MSEEDKLRKIRWYHQQLHAKNLQFLLDHCKNSEKFFMIVIDIRPREAFLQDRILHANCLCIPADRIDGDSYGSFRFHSIKQYFVDEKDANAWRIWNNLERADKVVIYSEDEKRNPCYSDDKLRVCSDIVKDYLDRCCPAILKDGLAYFRRLFPQSVTAGEYSPGEFREGELPKPALPHNVARPARKREWDHEPMSPESIKQCIASIPYTELAFLKRLAEKRKAEKNFRNKLLGISDSEVRVVEIAPSSVEERRPSKRKASEDTNETVVVELIGTDRSSAVAQEIDNPGRGSYQSKQIDGTDNEAGGIANSATPTSPSVEQGEEAGPAKIRKVSDDRIKNPPEVVEKATDDQCSVATQPVGRPLQATRRLNRIQDEEIDSRPRGISNFGASCYIGVILQCLGLTSEFYPVVHHWLMEVTMFSVKCKWTNVVLKTLKDLKVETSAPASIEHLKKLAQSIEGCIYGESAQQDAFEFFEFLLSTIHEELSSEDIESPIQEMFAITSVNILTRNCKKCGNVSHSTDPQTSFALSLPLINDSVIELEQCLQRYIQEEVLSPGKCNHCGKACQMSHRIKLKDLPRYLIFHLKRFGSRSKGESDGIPDTSIFKLNSKVTFPDKINLKPFMEGEFDQISPDKPVYYQVYAIVSHKGTSVHSGHYTAYGRGESSWHHFDDSRVQTISQTKINLRRTYLFFLERAYTAEDN